MGLVVVAWSWGRISYNFLFFLAGLQAIPRSVIEAAAIDGARFWTRFRTIVWPLLITTDPSMNAVVMGIKQMFPSGDDLADWPVIMATSILAMLPPGIVVIGTQRLFIRGLVDSEK